MKPFTQFLVEKEMAYDLALKTLGLTATFTKDELDAAHTRLLKLYHPDRPGGDAAKMALVNAARDSLKARSGGGSTYSRPTRPQWGDAQQDQRNQTDQADRERQYQERQQADHDRQEKYKIFYEMVKASFLARWNTEAFQRHFTTIFGEPFDITIDRIADPGSLKYAAAVQFKGEWANKGKTIVLEMTVFIDIQQLLNSRAIANPEDFLSMSITTEILYNRKKVKLTARDWKMSSEGQVLSNPEALFPSAKLKSQAAKSGTRRLSKRDVLLTFEKELGATVSTSGDKSVWVYVPVGIYLIAFWRMTISAGLYRSNAADSRMSTWGINGVYEKHKRVSMVPGAMMFAEDAPSMHWLWDELKTLQRQGTTWPVEAIVQSLIQISAKYKAKFRAPAEGA